MRREETTAITAAVLAAELGGEVVGPGDRVLRSCASLQKAGPDQLSFVANQKYAKDLATTQAAAVIVSPNVTPESLDRRADSPLALIRCADPYFAFRQAVVKLHGFRPAPPAGISPGAHVDASAKIGHNVTIGPSAVIGANVRIGDDCVIHANATILSGATLGNGCVVHPSCVIYEECVLGHRVILQAGAVIGNDGYGFATHGGIHHKIPQVGRVILEDDVEVGANTVVERAVLELTVIGQGTKLGNSVVIGHNCIIGQHHLLVSQVGIAGSTTTGRYVVMAGQVGVAGHLHIGDQVTVAAQSGLMQDVPDKQTIGGAPAMEVRRARKVYMHFMQLPELAGRIRALEDQLAELRKSLPVSKDA